MVTGGENLFNIGRFGLVAAFIFRNQRLQWRTGKKPCLHTELVSYLYQTPSRYQSPSISDLWGCVRDNQRNTSGQRSLASLLPLALE